MLITLTQAEKEHDVNQLHDAFIAADIEPTHVESDDLESRFTFADEEDEGDIQDVIDAYTFEEPESTPLPYLQTGENLADVDAEAARANLGLGTAATHNVGTSSGQLPVLDGSGKLASSVLPAAALTDTHVVASQAAMLALPAETGDVAVRTDLNKSFILRGTDPTTLSDWQELLTPTDSVQSVNGQTGAVTLAKSDVGLGNVTDDAQLKIASNLSDLNNPATARSNLGLGTAATQASGAFAAASHTHSASDITLGSLAQARQSVAGSGSYLIAPWEQYPASNVGCTVGSANQVSVITFIPKATISIASVHFDVQAASASGLCSVGVYSADGNTKLIDTGTKSTTSTGVQSATLGTPVTLYANTLYWLAYTHDNTTSAIRGIIAALTGASNILNAGTTVTGTAANAATAGALPSALGAISASSRPIPMIKLQG